MEADSDSRKPIRDAFNLWTSKQKESEKSKKNWNDIDVSDSTATKSLRGNGTESLMEPRRIHIAKRSDEANLYQQYPPRPPGAMSSAAATRHDS